MNDNQELLNAIVHTTQMGQTGIRTVRPLASDPALQQELTAQSKQYDLIEKEALQIARQRGWQISNVGTMAKKMSAMMARARLMGTDVDSKIAAMMIQGNTRGMILGIRDLHRSQGLDSQVLTLAQKLLDRENVNLQNCRRFL